MNSTRDDILEFAGGLSRRASVWVGLVLQREAEPVGLLSGAILQYREPLLRQFRIARDRGLDRAVEMQDHLAELDTLSEFLRGL